MTKAVTASMIGMMVEEGKMDFTTQLQELLPEYQRDDAQANITVADLLSHRTGLAPYDGLWLNSDNQILMNRSQAVPILSYAPVVHPIRTKFLYNNIAYEILGQILEKVSGSTYLELLHDRIIGPLKLNRTFYAEEPFDNNTAKSYAALADGSFYEIPPWGHGKDLLIGAAGAIRSSINDLLVLYKAFIDTANSQVDLMTNADAHNPLKQVPQLFEGKVSVPNKSLREFSYASGWIRAQLPAIVDVAADYVPPVLGNGSPSRLMIHHQGYIAGNVGFVALFPETSTAVVVLGNSEGLTDAMRLIGHILVETVFENEVNKTAYIETARTAGRDDIQFVADVHQQLIDTKSSSEPTRPLSAYTGRYYNSIGNYFIEINEVGGKLQVAYVGADIDTFDLEAYQTDSFFWWLDYDQSAKQARVPGYSKEYFTLEFGCPSTTSWWFLAGDVEMECLTWKHEFHIPGDGEVFRKRGSNWSIDTREYQRVLDDL
ncbi:beta-lactamase/transpeptidase-like protein, partial [Whalleya microplaca]